MDLQQILSRLATDPARITTYSGALNYVVSNVAPNGPAMAEIRALVQTQDLKERRWLEDRQALEARQTQRQQGKQTLERLLKIVDPAADSLSPDEVAARNQKELEAYDARVYQAMEQMMREQRQMLAELHVPLFCLAPGTQVTAEIEQARIKLLDVLRDLVDE